MIIAHTVPSFYPFTGGIELYVHEISKELAKRGHEVHVYAPSQVAKRKVKTAENEVCGVRIHYVPVILELSYRARVWPGLLGRLLKDKSDLIHSHGDGHYHSLASVIAARVRNKPLVVTTYGPLYKQTEFSTKKKLFFDAYDASITPFIFNQANKVLVRYPALTRWVESYGTSENKVGLAPSGVPKESLKPRNGKSFRKKYGINGSMVLYVGRISPQKGVQHLVEAACYVVKEIPNLKFVLVGPDYLGYTAALLKMARQYHVDGNVLFTGPIHNLEEEMEAYAACDVFVMPSSFEGFSQAVLKAMAQAKRVIVTNVGGLPYEVEEGECGILVPYGDSVTLANNICELIMSSELSNRLGVKARERAAMFTYDALASRLEKVYEEIARG